MNNTTNAVIDAITNDLNGACSVRLFDGLDCLASLLRGETLTSKIDTVRMGFIYRSDNWVHAAETFRTMGV